MPAASRRRPSICAQPGCPTIVTTGPRCPTHTVNQADRNRPNAAARGYDARWQAERRRYLLAHPHCQWPGCPAPATAVDHLDGLGPLGLRGYDWANLEGLCHPHHSTKTALYDGGYGNTPKTSPPPR